MIRKALFHPVTITCAIYILVYIGAEVSVGGWAYTYLVEGRHGDMITMGHVVSGYWAGLAAGRIVLGYLAEKYGVRLMVALFCIITEMCVVVLWVVDVIAVDSAGMSSAFCVVFHSHFVAQLSSASASFWVLCSLACSPSLPAHFRNQCMQRRLVS